MGPRELEAVEQRSRSQLSTNVMEALDADFDEGSAWLFLVTNPFRTAQAV